MSRARPPAHPKRRTATRLGKGALLLGGCASLLGGCAQLGAERDGRHLTQAVFADGYGQLARYYVRPPDPRRLTLDAAASLHSLDGHLRVLPNADASALLAEVDDVVVATFPLPPAPETDAQRGTADGATPEQARAWATVAADVAAWAQTVSPTLHDTYGWEGVRAAMLQAAMISLDPYTHYLPPPRAQAARTKRDGYAGVGLSLEQAAPGRFQVSEVAPDGPAAQAGIKVGDHLLAVNGTAINGLDLVSVFAMLHGPVGAGVTLTLQRPLADTGKADGIAEGAGTPKEQRLGPPQRLTLVRQRLFQTTVSAHEDQGVGWLRITRFNAGTAAALAVAIERLKTGPTPPTAWVLDLRGNPGGLLDQAIAVADLLLDKGDILITRGRHPDSLQHYTVGGPGIALPAGLSDGDHLAGQPLAVLVDGKTASAAEVLAAALADNGRAPLIGSTTFGKGVVQTLARLPDGGEMAITWSRIVTPAGTLFDHEGLHPVLCTAGRQAVSGVLAELDAPAPACPTQTGDNPLDGAVALALLDSAGAHHAQALALARHAAPPPPDAMGGGIGSATQAGMDGG